MSVSSIEKARSSLEMKRNGLCVSIYGHKWYVNIIASPARSGKFKSDWNIEFTPAAWPNILNPASNGRMNDRFI